MPCSAPRKSARLAATAAHSRLRKSSCTVARKAAWSSTGTALPSAENHSNGPLAAQPSRRSAARVADNGPRQRARSRSRPAAQAAPSRSAGPAQPGTHLTQEVSVAVTAASAGSRRCDGPWNAKSTSTARREPTLRGAPPYAGPWPPTR